MSQKPQNKCGKETPSSPKYSNIVEERRGKRVRGGQQGTGVSMVATELVTTATKVDLRPADHHHPLTTTNNLTPSSRIRIRN